jgi:hypothetical protein
MRKKATRLQPSSTSCDALRHAHFVRMLDPRIEQETRAFVGELDRRSGGRHRLVLVFEFVYLACGRGWIGGLTSAGIGEA